MEYHLLLVEDERIQALAVTRLLTDAGYSVTHAQTGEEAVALIASGSPPIDLVLMDVDLGAGIDGSEAARQILEGRDVAVLFMFSCTGRDVVSRTESVASYGYVSKDSGDAVLLASVRSALRLLRRFRDGVAKHSDTLRRYAAIERDGSDLIYAVAQDGTYTYVSANCRRLLGYTADELRGMSFRQITHPDDLPVIRAWWKEVEAHGYVHRPAEYRVFTKDGSIRWHQLAGQLTDDPDQELIGICRDVTDAKETERRLRVAVQERDLLLSELRHRVKNNFGVISSLLSMQMNHYDAPADVSALVEARNRVDAISRIYSRLDERNGSPTVNLGDYLVDIAHRTFDAYSANVGDVELETNVAALSVNTKSASTIGLLLNELMTNALKYAFPESTSGKISVGLSRVDDKVMLSVRDTGVGVSEATQPGLGTTIVSALSEQLGADLSIQGCTDGPGTCAGVAIPAALFDCAGGI